MANLKVTDLGSIPVVTLTDLIHVVDVSDTSGSPQGTSTKATIQQLQAIINTGETFIALSDTPANYTGSAGKVVQVNAGGTALEFATSSGASIYTSNDTIGTGRVATLTDTLTFTGGEVTIKGANDASGSKALVIKNDSGDEILRLENDREIFLGTAAANRIRSGSGGGGRMIGGVGNSAATPAFGFFSSNGIDDGSGGNGWYRPITANNQAWSTASTERMRLNQGGNLGIGLSTQSARLHVKGQGATNTTAALKLDNSLGGSLFSMLDDGSFFIGAGATTQGPTAVSIGKGADAKGLGSVSIGNNTMVDNDAGGGSAGIAIGQNTQGRTDGIAIGSTAYCYATNISIGASAGDYNTTNAGIVTIGNKLRPTGANSINLAARNSSAANIVPNEADTFGVYLSNTATANTPDLKFRLNNTSYWNSTGAFGFGTATPDASALLDVNSTSKGFLPPRMTTAQRAVINAGTGPAKGLIIYNTTTDQWEGNAGTPGTPNWVILG